MSVCQLLLLLFGGWGHFRYVSTFGLSMAGVRAGVIAGRRMQSGCELPSIPYGSTNWAGSRRRAKLSVNTIINVECNFGKHLLYEHINVMHCADREGSWEFPDDANFTLPMLDQLCIAPRVDEIDSDHYLTQPFHSDRIVSTVPLILGSAFVLSILILTWMIFRSKFIHRQMPPPLISTPARNYVHSTDTNSLDEGEETRPTPTSNDSNCCHTNFINLSDIVEPAHPHNLQCHCHHPPTGWHDRIFLDESRVYASYNRLDLDNTLPTYEEAMKYSKPKEELVQKEP